MEESSIPAALRETVSFCRAFLNNLIPAMLASVLAVTALSRVWAAQEAQLVVQLRAGELHRLSALTAKGGPVRSLVPLFSPKNRELAREIGLDRFYIARGTSVAEMRRRLRSSPSVEYAGSPVPVVPALVPNDPLFSQQWALRNTGGGSGLAGADIKAVQAWDITTGSSSVTVAVLDTGVDSSHPDLAANMAPGRSFVDGEPGTDDNNGHGTNCAGIIGAVGNNALQISGVSWNSRIMPVKVIGLDANGNPSGTDLWLSQGIIWAVDNGAKVLSISLVSSSDTLPLRSAVRYARQSGAIVVAASGNQGEQKKMYPAGYDDVIAVGASDQWDQRASFSNWGDHLDLVAPGIAITTTTRGGGTWQFFGGTSAAAPHVAGICALVLSVRPATNLAEMRQFLRRGADDIGDPGYDIYTGAGRANAYVTLLAALDPTPPPAPSVTDSGRYTGNPNQLALQWTPSSDPESGIEGYEYAVGTSGNPTSLRGWTWVGNTTAVTATGLNLPPDTPVFASVRARNGARLYSNAAVTDGIIYAPPAPATGTALLLPNGRHVTLNTRTVSAVFPERLWITDYPYGPALAVQPPAPCSVGNQVTAVGRLETIAGIRTLTDAEITITGFGPAPPALNMRQNALGGGPLNGETPGVTGGTGVNTVGRLVRTSGRVTASGEGWFTVDDGSGLRDAGGFAGVRVVTGGTAPEAGTFVRVTGIVEVSVSGEAVLPVIRTRQPEDVEAVEGS